MTQKFSRDDLVARLVRAGELEVSGDAPDEVGDYFAPDFAFHGPGGFESDYAGLAGYFESLRAAFDDRSIRRGIVLVEGNQIACQTWIEGTFVRNSPSPRSARSHPTANESSSTSSTSFAWTTTGAWWRSTCERTIRASSNSSASPAGLARDSTA